MEGINPMQYTTPFPPHFMYEASFRFTSTTQELTWASSNQQESADLEDIQAAKNSRPEVTLRVGYHDAEPNQ